MCKIPEVAEYGCRFEQLFVKGKRAVFGFEKDL
jgi:hypothetical protein